MRLEGLNENDERGLLASAQYAATLIRDCEQILAATAHPRPFSRYAGTVTPQQRKILGEYLRRLDAQLARLLEGLGLRPPAASVDALWAVNTALAFLDTTVEEMRGRYLRGYGEVSVEADRVLDGLVSETQALIREVGVFVSGAPNEVLRQRADRLPHDHPLRSDVQTLARIITDHGLVDLRPALGLLLDRAMETTFEVAVVGRVSSGKSTLLNALIGSSLLPTGVLPVTAFPTRLRRGPAPRVQIVPANGNIATASLERLDEFVTEAKNPGNEKRLARLLVEYPSGRLPEGVTFVDTPGLGSVESTGVLQTFAYLPRCDHATFLFEAGAPVTEEDVGVLAFLQESGITTSVLLSKADLLSPGDLEQVRAYVADQIRRRAGRAVAIRPISTIPGYEGTLESWIADEVAPLEGHARAAGSMHCGAGWMSCGGRQPLHSNASSGDTRTRA
jgi:GTP-binding protein EngB required for normal cell division